jgi:hypothetical protein
MVEYRTVRCTVAFSGRTSDPEITSRAADAGIVVVDVTVLDVACRGTV